MNPEERKALRKAKIAARDNLTVEQRHLFSKSIVARILDSRLFQDAKTVLIYSGVRGEVRLDGLEEAVKDDSKRLLYPLCISKEEMIALLPQDRNSWKKGYCGILEPIREKSQEIQPEEIDLVICPCTAFDENGGRMGMGAGFYDRYLEKCINARVISVAFEVQKAEAILMESWDRPMEMIFTENTVYCAAEKTDY